MAFWNRKKSPARSSVQSQPSWRRSRPHLFLLTKFRGGATRSGFDSAQYWVPLLKEAPATAIQRFIDEGMIEKAGLSEVLTDLYTVDALRSFLKKQELSVSGTKGRMVERLVTNCEELMREATAGVDYWRCSSSGLEIADAYSVQEKQSRDKAMSESMTAFLGGDIRKAVLIVVEYDRTQVFARNIPVDETVNVLEAIAAGYPGILKGMDSQRMDTLRPATAMMHLWGDRDVRPWLPPDWASGIHLDAITSARMLEFSAVHTIRMCELHEQGFKKVEILGCLDADTCAACMKMHDKRFLLSSPPELPNPNCTSLVGCRCAAIPSG